MKKNLNDYLFPKSAKYLPEKGGKKIHPFWQAKHNIKVFPCCPTDFQIAPFKCKHGIIEPKFCYNQRIHKEIPLTVVLAEARLRLLRLLGNLTKKAGEALTMLG